MLNYFFHVSPGYDIMVFFLFVFIMCVEVWGGCLVQPSDVWHGHWVLSGYSGLTNEKPWNSSWSRLAISSESGGVSSGGWRVKKRSKFSASRPHCRGEERGGDRERDGEGGVSWMRDVKKKRDNNKQREKREIQLKHGINQSNRSQPKLWISIGLHVSHWNLSFIIGDYTHKS